MTLEQLKQTAQSLIDADKLKSSGEWTSITTNECYSEIETDFDILIGYGSQLELENGKFIELAANNSASLAEKLIKCIDALESISKSNPITEWPQVMAQDFLKEITK